MKSLSLFSMLSNALGQVVDLLVIKRQIELVDEKKSIQAEDCRSLVAIAENVRSGEVIENVCRFGLERWIRFQVKEVNVRAFFDGKQLVQVKTGTPYDWFNTRPGETNAFVMRSFDNSRR